jgi:hypothetical protein
MREVVGMFSRPSVTVQSSCGDSCSSLHLPDAAQFEPPLRRLNGAGTVVTAPALQVPAAVGTAVGTASASASGTRPSVTVPDAADFEPALRRLHGAGTVVTSAPALHVPAAVGTASASASSTCQASFRIELTQLPMERSRTLVSSRMLALVLYCWSLHKAFFW